MTRVMHLVSKFVFAYDDDNGANSQCVFKIAPKQAFGDYVANPPLHNRNQIADNGAFLCIYNFRQRTS